MLRPSNFNDTDAEGHHEAAELFSASPLPDRYSTPRVNLTAKSVFDVEPGSGPPAPMMQPILPTTSHVEDTAVNLVPEPSLDFAPEEAKSSTVGTRSTSNSPHHSPAHTPNKDSVFVAGDLVWAQTDVQFAYWPALVIEPSNLPDSLREAYNFTSRGGKATKIPVYFYGKNDYDVVLPARMKDYDEHRKALADQDRPNGLSGGLYVMFKRAMRLANENLSKDPAQRTDWIVRNRADPKETISRANSTSGNNSVGSAHGGRALSRPSSAMMHITTESHEGSTVYANAALQMSPLSDTYTAGGYTPTPSDGTKPSRFPFPEPVPATVLQTVEEGADTSPLAADHIVPSLVDNLPPLTVLGSPRRTPSRTTSREGHAVGLAPVEADHAALMAIASEAVDRALLDNYEIVDLSPSQLEEVAVSSEAMVSPTISTGELVSAEPEPIPTVAEELAEEAVSAQTTAESPDQPVQGVASTQFFDEPADNTFFPPDHAESDVFSQISPGVSNTFDDHGETDFQAGMIESKNSIEDAEVPVEQPEAVEEEHDGSVSASADFLLDVPLHEEADEMTDVPLEEVIEEPTTVVVPVAVVEEQEPGHPEEMVDVSLDAEVAMKSVVDDALVTESADSVTDAFVEPPRPFDQQPSPVTGSPIAAFGSESSPFGMPSANNTVFSSPAKASPELLGATTPVRVKTPTKGDASSLFGASSESSSLFGAISTTGSADSAFGAPPVVSPVKPVAPAAADLFASPPAHDAFVYQAPVSVVVPAPVDLFAAAPPVAPVAPFTPKTNDASSLFGGGDDSDLFGPPAPSLPPPPQRVTSGGRTAVATTSAPKGLFDAAPPSSSLFGAPPTVASGPAPVPKKVVSAKLTPTTAASDLFGSAPADSLFGGPAASAPAPAVRPVHATVSTAGVFGSSPAAAPTDAGLSKKASFKGSPSRPVADAASLFGGSASSDPFSFGAAPAPAVFSPPAPVPAARPPVAPVPVVSAADLFGAPPSTAAELFGAPSAEPATGLGSVPAAPVVAVAPPSAIPSAQVPVPVQAHASERSVPPVAAQVTAVPPFSPALGGSHTDTASFFGAEPSPVSVPVGNSVPSGLGSDSASSRPTTPNVHLSAPSGVQDLFGAPPVVPLKTSDSADSLFAAAAATTVHSISPPPSVLSRTATAPVVSSTMSQLQMAAAVASENNMTHASAVNANAAAVASATVSQPTLQRHASAGPVFKGRAKLVQGSSPFDTPAPAANTADVLFGGSTTAGNSNVFGAAAASSNMFGAAPASDPFAAPSSHAGAFGSSSHADLFSAPPPGAASPYTTSHSVKKTTKGKDKSQLSASDVFGSSAPVEAAKPYVAVVDPFSPPTAPGVKVASKPAPLSIATNNTGTGSGVGHGANAAASNVFAVESAFNSPAVGSAPNSPFVHDANQGNINPNGVASSTVPIASTSGKARTAVPVKGKKAPPPGMIATPHGYVPIASLNAAPVPATTTVEGISGLSKPLVSHDVLTSLVTETKEPVLVEVVPSVVSEPTSVNVPVSATHTATNAATTLTVSGARNNRIKPTAAIASFGFGGKLVVMLPKLHYTPVFNPAYGVANNNTEGAKHYNGPLRVYNVIDVVTSSVQGGYVTKGAAETMELCKLMTMFPGPLSSHQPATATSNTTEVSPSTNTTTAEDLVRDALQHRVDCPLTGLLADPSAARPDTSSEKLLWSLLKLCVDRNGSLCTDNASSGHSENTPHGHNNTHSSGAEVRICQLLMGHATANATAGATSAMPNVAVFSGSASGAVTSYAPDMSKSTLLHANFHSTADPSKPPTGAHPVTSEQYSEIESLLVVGRKEDALRKAIHYQEWSLALLIGSVCGAEKYAEVVQSYSHSHFPRATPLHLLTLMYADLGSKAILPHTGPTTTTTSTHTTIINSNGLSNDVLTLWRHNLSAILSNKPNNWQQLANFLGYRLQHESKDVFAAHSAYLTAGAFPTFPVATIATTSNTANRGLMHAHSAEHLPDLENTTTAKNAGKYSLLGCDITLSKHRALADCVSISALRATEILEFTLLKKLHALQCDHQVTSGGDGIASLGKSLTDMFNWKGSSNSVSSNNNNAAVPPKSPRRGTSGGPSAAAGANNTAAPTDAAAEAKLRYKVNKVRVVLCPLKVRFAMILADFGLIKESVAYALEARALVQEIGVAEDKNKTGATSGPAAGKGRSAAPSGSAGPSASTTNATIPGEPVVKPFNRHFVRALDEFIDRLGVNDKARAVTGSHRREGSTGSATTSNTTSNTASSGSLFGSMISNINLKNLVDMVDGPNAVPATTAAAATTTAVNTANVNTNAFWNSSSPFDAPAPAVSMPPLATRGSSTNLSTTTATIGMPPPSVYNSTQMSSVGGPPPHPSGHMAPPSVQNVGATAGNNTAYAPGPGPAPASTAQYAPMSSLPPRPGNMVVPPSAVPGAGHNNTTKSGSLPHSTSQSNLQSPPPQYAQHANAYPAGPGPNNSVPPNNSGYSTGGSDFFDEVDLASPDKQSHQQQSQQQSQAYNAAPSTSTPYGYPSYNANPNQGTQASQHGGQGNQSNAPPSQYPAQQQAAAWSSGAHPAHSPAHGTHSPHMSQCGTPPTQQYSQHSPANNNNSTSATASVSAPPASGFFGFGGSSASTNATSSAPQTLPPRANPQPSQQNQQSAPPASARPAAAAVAPVQEESSSGGLFGGFRKSILARWYPDAHDANDNIGKSLEAVFNKETGRWEFPGEENAAPSAASLPPPTGPMGGGSGHSSGMSSLGVSPSPSMSAFGNVGGPPGPSGPPGGGPPGNTPGGSGGSEAYDAMAALMAPPSRRMPSSYSTSALSAAGDNTDPLAAMMAPPSSRYSMPHSNSTLNMNTPMPNINVWKPPPAPVSVMPVQRVVYDDTSMGGNSDVSQGNNDANAGDSAGNAGASLGPPPM